MLLMQDEGTRKSSEICIFARIRDLRSSERYRTEPVQSQHVKPCRITLNAPHGVHRQESVLLPRSFGDRI